MASKALISSENVCDTSKKFAEHRITESGLEPKSHEGNPMKEINILLLGATGVGKSTWINAIANYAAFDSTAQAARKPICVIPASFKIVDHNRKQHEINIGESDPVNENFSKIGASVTQNAIGHVFNIDETRILRLIDTPGVGDARGTVTDQMNFDNILRYLTTIDELHGICILLRPDENRLNVVFRYCITELLTHLHRSAVDNIVFCFTHSRATFFSPGATQDLLQELADELKAKNGIKIPLESKNMFYFDSESFKYVCALHNSVKIPDRAIEGYEKSWEMSAQETSRFFKYIYNLTPHDVKEMLSINACNRIAEKLVIPMTEIAQDIAFNMLKAEDQREKIESLPEEEREILKDRVGVTVRQRKVKSLPSPQTVCMTCSQVKPGEDEQCLLNGAHHVYTRKQICCKNCKTISKNPESIRDSSIIYCQSIFGSTWYEHIGNYIKSFFTDLRCKKCGCKWDAHMRMFYDYSFIEVHETDAATQELINAGADPQLIIEQAKKGIAKVINDLQGEKDMITDSIADLLSYVKNNAITPYNNIFEEYVDYMIQNLKSGGQTGHAREIKILQDLKILHQQKMKFIEEGDDNAGRYKMTNGDVYALRDQLIALPKYGAYIKNAFEAVMVGDRILKRYNDKEHKLEGTVFRKFLSALSFQNLRKRWMPA